MGWGSVGSGQGGGSGQEVFRLKEDMSEKKNHCQAGPSMFLRHTDSQGFQLPGG